MTTMLRTGQQIAGYRVEALLASGGMGVVYRATQLSLGRTVALKVLAPHLSADAEFRERFRREAALQAQLEHPHIVRVYETGESEEGLFLALSYVAGTDLRRLIDAGSLGAERALRLLAQVAAALDAAHEAGLVHRDVKPQNVLVDGREHAYLADFGLTKGDGARGLTRTGAYVGSLDYVAPELVRGEQVTAASDRYALTAVLYECLTREVPFPRETEAALLYAHVSEPPPRPSERRRGLARAVDDVVARGLAKDPGDRYATAGELVGAAAAALELAHAAPGGARRRFGETIVDPALRRRAPVIALEQRRGRPAAPLLAAVVLLCAGAAAAGFLLGHSWTRVRHPPLGIAVAGPVALSFPTPDWRPAAAPALRRLHLRDPVALAGRGRARGAALVAGVVPRVDARTLLPFPVRRAASLGHVRLDRYEAMRYRGALARKPAATDTLYAVPVGLGAATVVCTSPAGAPGAEARARCENVATTLALRGIAAGTIGPDRRYATVLRASVRRLAAVRRSERQALAAARKPGERAGHAEVLASALADTTAQLEGVVTGSRETPLRRRLARALGRARDGYVSLAASLRAADRSGYLEAASRIREAEAAADASIRGLARLGYPLP